jgi:tRNA pseudouridine55 synthase
MDGVLVVDKPAGPTSHDIVERVRRLVRPARVGHLGTLDPLATGVLPLCLGSATRLARFLAGGLKEYTGEIVLGIATDSYDAAGRITRQAPIADLTLNAVRSAAFGLRGDLKQVPPAWSAKKIEGKRSYDLARRGEARALAACDVRVDRFDVLDLIDGSASFRVVCTGGTYVRSLAHELGRTLACGAHLGSLRRIASGPFRIEEATPPGELENAARAGRLGELIRPLETLDLGLSWARLTGDGERLAAAGRFVPAGELAESNELPGTGLVRLLSPRGCLLGIGEVAAAGSPGLQPRIVLPRES